MPRLNTAQSGTNLHIFGVPGVGHWVKILHPQRNIRAHCEQRVCPFRFGLQSLAASCGATRDLQVIAASTHRAR